MPSNLLKKGMLLAVLTAIFGGMGALIGGTGGMVIAFAIALAMNAFSLWGSDTVVLRMYGAQEVDEARAPGFYRIVAQLAQRAGLPMPRVYVMHNAQPNAFATGPSPQRAAVCASTGLLESLSDEELAGVIAHELAHVKNRDTLTMSVAATIGGAISMLANIMQFSLLFGGGRRENGGGGILGTIAAVLVAPFAAMLVQMAISRSREYEADRVGAAICGHPLWLASALARIQNAVHQVPNAAAEAVPATAHLFIINPLTGHGMDNLFSTHPNTQNRIAALQALAQQWGDQGSAGLATGSSAVEEPPAQGPWGATPRGPWG